jgi:hypothetical protein
VRVVADTFLSPLRGEIERGGAAAPRAALRAAPSPLPLVVLYSAAGGGLRSRGRLPQGIASAVFLCLGDRDVADEAPGHDQAGDRLSRLRHRPDAAGRGRGAGLRRQGRAALAQSRLHQPPALRADEAGDRARLARFYDLLPAGEMRGWSAIWPAAALLGIPAAFILVQPDLGTAIMVLLCGTVMFLAGLPLRLFVGGASPSGRGADRVRHDARLSAQADRLSSSIPESDPLGAGYHIAQSKIAIGSGGIWGKGFLHGTQSHLELPAREAYRLHVRDHGRGMGPGRRHPPDRRLRLIVIRWG